MSTQNDEGGDETAELNVLKLRYEELLEAHDSQKESWEKEGEHSRRMFRLVLVLLGVVVTALSIGGFDSLNTAIFSEPYCAVESGSICLSTRALLYVGIFSLLTSTYFYVKGATGGILVGAPPAEYTEDNLLDERPELEEFEEEAEYLECRIEELEDALTDGFEKHLSAKYNERIGAISLILGITSLTLLAFSITAGRGLPVIPILLGGVLLTVIIFAVEWKSSKPIPPIQKLKDVVSGENP